MDKGNVNETKPLPSLPAPLSPQSVREQTARILASQRFAAAGRLRNFLRFVVEMALEGRSAEVKEYLIAIEVYGRKPDYDPKVDSIVRVEAGRLRSRLREYYDTEGNADPIRVDLPKGSYVPLFRSAELPVSPPATPSEETNAAGSSAGGPIPDPDASEQKAKLLPGSNPIAPPPGRSRWLWAATGTVVIAAVLFLTLRSRQPARSSALSIMVVPFANLTLDPKHDVLAKGLTKDIESALTQSGALRVLGGASPKDSRADLALEGSVRIDQDRFHVVVQMLHLKEGGYVWSQTYESQSADLFGLQTMLAQSICRDSEAKALTYAQELAAAGTPRGRAIGFLRQARPQPRYESDGFLMRGPSTIERLALDEVNRSISLLEKAVAADPTFAIAHSGLAAYYSVAGDYDPRMFPKAKQSAYRALELDPNMGEPHNLLGQIAFLSEWNFRSAEEHLRRTTQLEPRILTGYRLYADLLCLLDKPDEALRTLERGRVIYPKNPVLETSFPVVLYNSGRFEEMARRSAQVLREFPNFPLAHWVAGLSLEQQKRYPEAIAEFETCLQLSPQDGRCTVAVGHAYAKAGRRADAIRVAEQYRTRPGSQYAAPYSRALISNALGDRKAAIHFLEASFDARESGFPYLKVEPRLMNLRSDPIVAGLLRQIGL